MIIKNGCSRRTDFELKKFDEEFWIQNLECWVKYNMSNLSDLKYNFQISLHFKVTIPHFTYFMFKIPCSSSDSNNLGQFQKISSRFDILQISVIISMFCVDFDLF